MVVTEMDNQRLHPLVWCLLETSVLFSRCPNVYMWAVLPSAGVSLFGRRHFCTRVARDRTYRRELVGGGGEMVERESSRSVLGRSHYDGWEQAEMRPPSLARAEPSPRCLPGYEEP